MTDASSEVGVVVPTRNSARTLQACLESLRSQDVRPTIVVVDNHSSDETLSIAEQLADIVEVAGPERSAQRNRGAELLANVEVIGFIDSDMVLEPSVVGQVLREMHAGADAIVIPEYTMGRGFVAKVRAFERAQYVGASQVEAPRFFGRRVFEQVGGFDEELNAGEDWDLAIRVASSGALRGRTTACIWHDEGRVGYLAHCRKKGLYASGLKAFFAKHGSRGHGIILDRPYLRHPWRLARHPLLGMGLVALKAGETTAVMMALLRDNRDIKTTVSSPLPAEFIPRESGKSYDQQT